MTSYDDIANQYRWKDLAVDPTMEDTQILSKEDFQKFEGMQEFSELKALVQAGMAKLLAKKPVSKIMPFDA